MKQVITLADLEAKSLSRLAITCDRCPRRGVYRVARLVEHDAGAGAGRVRG